MIVDAPDYSTAYPRAHRSVRPARAIIGALAVAIVAASCVWSCAAFFTPRPFGPFTSVRAPVTAYSDVITGLASCDAVGAVGLLDDGSAFYVSDWCTGTTFKYALRSGAPGKPIASALNGLTNGLALDDGGYYGIAGRHQTSALPGIYAFDPGTLELDREIATAPCHDTRGLAADPVTGDLYVTGDCGLWRISGVDTPHPVATRLVRADFDGVAFTPGGSTLWVANVAADSVEELSPAGTLLAAVSIPHGAVGVAAVSAATRSSVAADVFVSDDDGSVLMINTRDHDAVSAVAVGGYRNEYLTIGPDGYLYDAKLDRVDRLQPAIFGPVTPSRPALSPPRTASRSGSADRSWLAPLGWALAATAAVSAGVIACWLTRRRGRRRRADAADPVTAAAWPPAAEPSPSDLSPPADTALDRLRWALTDPDLLPSATSLRFAVLVLTIVASAGSVYAHLSVIARPAADAAAGRCLAAAARAVNPAATVTANPFGCVDRYAPSLALWSAAGITLVLLATALVYTLTPWQIRNLSRSGAPLYRDPQSGRWRARRPWWIPGGPSQRLPELDRTKSLQAAAADRLDQLSAQVGVAPPPIGLLNVSSNDTDARAFGAHGRSFVLLNFGLIVQFRRDPRAFDATIRHELAHLRNRDSRPTYATLAAWRVFVVLVLVPYVVSLIAPGVIRDPLRASAYRLASAAPDPRIAAAIATLTALVFLASRAVIRTREAHADCTAARYDGGALRRAIKAAAESDGRAEWADFARYHPGWRRRLRDLDNPGRLIPPGDLTMVTLGIATSLLVVNTGFNVALGALGSWLTPATIASLERAIAAGNRPTVLGFQLLLYGPSTLLLLAIVVGFCCLAGWRASLCGQAASGDCPPDPPGRRRIVRAVLRDALPLVAGLMIGEPLSAIYADAGTWGVFDTSLGRDLVDVAVSAVALAIIVGLILAWARESAAAWPPVARRSLRTPCAAAIVVGIIATAPAALTWIAAHNNAGITGFSFPPVAATISTWFGAHWDNADYYPLNFLTALPGAGLLFALPGLYCAVAATRNRRTADIKVAIVVGLGAAVISELVCLALALTTRRIPGAAAMRAAFDAGQNAPYLPIAWMSWAIVTICVLATVVVVRRTGGYNVATVLLTTVITAVGAAFLVLPDLFISYCGRAAFSCATQEPHDLLAAYGLLSGFTTVDAALATVLTLVLAFLIGRARPRSARPDPASDQRSGARRRTGRATRVIVAVILAANALAGVYVFYTSVLAW